MQWLQQAHQRLGEKRKKPRCFLFDGRKMRKDHVFGSEDLKSSSNHYTGGGTSILCSVSKLVMMLQWWVIDFFRNQGPGPCTNTRKSSQQNSERKKYWTSKMVFVCFFVSLFISLSLGPWNSLCNLIQVVNHLYPLKITSAWFELMILNSRQVQFFRKNVETQNLVSAGRPLFPGENGVDQLVEIVKVKGEEWKDSDSGVRFLGWYLMMAGLYLLGRKIHISYIKYIYIYGYMLHIHILYIFNLLHNVIDVFLQGITFRIAKFSGSGLVQGLWRSRQTF